MPQCFGDSRFLSYPYVLNFLLSKLQLCVAAATLARFVIAVAPEQHLSIQFLPFPIKAGTPCTVNPELQACQSTSGLKAGTVEVSERTS